MIERGQGNLLSAQVDALVNTVNTVGVMGKGLALQFKKAFPENFAEYERAFRSGELAIGKMHVVTRVTAPRYIINFPTKAHWKTPSKLEYIRLGLSDLVVQISARNIHSIAVPPLGCGNGGLEWNTVRPLIVDALSTLRDVRIVLFEPSPAPAAHEILDRTAKPAMTASRAAVIALMARYQATHYEYRLSLIEVQKLTYFLQTAGENLRLEFRPHHYGPYADNLRKALRNMEGHYTVGLADGKNSPTTELQLQVDAARVANDFLRSTHETQTRLERVAKLIEGFETPYGMELLATVHWVMTHGADPSRFDDVLTRVHSWHPRKRSQMKDGHVRAAWERLRLHEWA